MPSITSSTVTPSLSAISRGVGERPSSWAMSPVTELIDIRSSWSRRGTRIAQPLSRK